MCAKKFIFSSPTARNLERGESAVAQLEGEGLNPEFLLLDVDSEESIRAAKEMVEKKYGRLDVLVNNAGILLRVSVLIIMWFIIHLMPVIQSLQMYIDVCMQAWL